MTTTTSTTTTTTLPPSPAPTARPTLKTTEGTPKPTRANENLNFKCYWVQSDSPATCEVYNEPFMTNCIGYSIDGQPNAWYIQENDKGKDECIVESFKNDTNANVAAIATCYYLIN